MQFSLTNQQLKTDESSLFKILYRKGFNERHLPKMDIYTSALNGGVPNTMARI